MKRHLAIAVGILAVSSVLAGPNPPTAEDPNISITPATRSFDQKGGTGAINTAGSGTWQASVSDSWISLVSGASGTVGYAVGYTVSANDGVEARTGYVYVSGHVHTIVQAGVGARLSSHSASFESEGGTGRVTVSAPSGKSWHAKSNVDWITVEFAVGSGTQAITFNVAKYTEVSTRSGTLTIADNTFTVHQTGARMKLAAAGATTDYLSERIKIRVNALADTEWTVSESEDWIAVTDAGNGRGGDVVEIELSENQSYNSRTGIVRIGTESFSVRQLGRTSLVFTVDVKEAAFGKDGTGNERVQVTATADLGWTASSSADWIELLAKGGSGSGTVTYRVKPNPTLYPRMGEIVVTAEDSAVAAKRIAISQAEATASLSMDGYEFDAAGETVTVGLTTDGIVGWNVQNTNSWVSISGVPAAGPAELVLKASANTSVKPRSGVIRIADHDFLVSQRGRGVTVSYESRVFDTDGKTEGDSAENVIAVSADSDVSWTADASDATWIVVYEGMSGIGNGTVKYLVAPYIGSGETRMGTITIGDQVVYITQRPYDLDINPKAEWVKGNAGAGEIQVALDIQGVWNAIATEPWITIVQGYNAGTGSGKVLFSYPDNNTGKTRTGKIVIAGEAYTITQEARKNVAISVETVGNGGYVSGGGVYELGASVTLQAHASDGYVFTGWILPDGSRSDVAEFEVKATAAQSYKACFAPLTPDLSVVDTSAAGVTLGWTNIAWATSYRIWRGATSDRAAAAKIAEVPNGEGLRTYIDKTGAENSAYWYWVNAVGGDDETWSDGVKGVRGKRIFKLTYRNLRGTTHANPQDYTEGSNVSFSAPSARKGFSFVGWEPAAITADTTGDKTVYAVWRQNEYNVRYDAQGGAGTMPSERWTYGFWKDLSSAAFSRVGCTFAGWALSKGAGVKYEDEEGVKDLCAGWNEEIVLYAVWNVNVSATVEGHGGTVSGSGRYVYGDKVTLRAVADDGYEFLCWSVGGKEITSGKYTFTASSGTSPVAHFAPLTPEFVSVECSSNGVRLAWTNLAWATDYRVYRSETETIPASPLVTLGAKRTNNMFLDATAEPHVAYWYWIEAVGPKDVTVTQTPVSGEIIVFSPITYTNLRGATHENPSTYQEKLGMTFSPPESLTGYTFAGWTPASITAADVGPKTVKANWTVNSYVITFDANGGSGGKKVTQNYGTALFAPAVTRTGYTFLGWSPAVPSKVPATNATYRAQWRINKYTVTFDANGGSGGKSMTQDYGTELTLPEVTRKGYTFVGWSPSVVLTNLSANATYTAQWQINKYTVTLDANGGSGGKSVTQDYGTSLALPTPTREGYTFIGWFTQTSGGAKVNSPLLVEDDATYYAQWTATFYQLALKSTSTKGGTASGGGTYAFGSKATIKAKAKKGDVFAGWFSDKKCTKPFDLPGYDYRSQSVEYVMPAKDTTIYAKFVTVAADKKALKFSSETKKLAKTPAKATAGNAFSLKLGISSASLPTVTAKGLPKGLSIDTTTGEMTGTATKPGSYTATVTVKDAAGNKITQKVKITVNAPSWAKGTFYGTAKPGKKASDPAAYLQFTVGSTGKVSGKVTYKGKKYSFTSSYASCTSSKAKFSPNVKIGSSTFKPGTVTVKKVAVDGLSVVEAANAKGTFAAQKKLNLVKKGKKLAKLVGKKFTFTKKDKNSGLAKSKDKLAVTVSNGDAVKVSGTVNGKKLSASLPLLVSNKATADGVTTYTLYADIIEPTLKYVRTLVFTATVGPSGVAVNAAFAE